MEKLNLSVSVSMDNDKVLIATTRFNIEYDLTFISIDGYRKLVNIPMYLIDARVYQFKHTTLFNRLKVTENNPHNTLLSFFKNKTRKVNFISLDLFIDWLSLDNHKLYMELACYPDSLLKWVETKFNYNAKAYIELYSIDVENYKNYTSEVYKKNIEFQAELERKKLNLQRTRSLYIAKLKTKPNKWN